MAKLLKALDSIICLLLLSFSLATSARILEQVVSTQTPLPADAPDASHPIPPREADTLDPAQPAATSVAPSIADPSTPAGPAPVVAPVPDVPNADTTPPLTTGVPPVTTPAAGGNAVSDHHPTLSFFMHDILGGSHPSGRVVTGVVTNSDANNLPFSNPNNQIFPIDGGVPLNTINGGVPLNTINGGVPLNTINGVINNNNYPFLVGLNGSPTDTLVQSNGNNVVAGNNQAFVTAGQLPAGVTLQQLMFGSVTVVDNEITEGHELGSSVLRKAQGFYLTSSTDGSSHTLLLTVILHGGNSEIVDTVSFFGIHRTATPISHIAIIGGTGKYENAKGYATIETPHEDQHTTDGLETITHFTLYLTP